MPDDKETTKEKDDEQIKEENERLRREIEKLRKENEALRKAKQKIAEEYKQYRTRHPETVGVKHGKPYTILISTRKRKRKRAGAKIGHKPAYRKIPDETNETKLVPIDECPFCHGHELSGVQEIRERTVEDIPECKPWVTRFSIERKYCRTCNQLVESDNVPALPKAKIGLRAMLTVTWLKIGLRMTEEAIPKVLWVLFGFRICEGEVIQILDQVARAFGPYYEELVRDIKKAPTRYIDETTWRIDGDNAWLWGFISKGIALYKIARTRAHTVPLEVVGKSAPGVNVHDRYSVYKTLSRKIKGCRNQDCWAHILADSKEHAQFYGDEGKFIHCTLKRIHKKALKFDHKGTPEDVEALVKYMEKKLLRPYKSIHCHRFIKNLLKWKDNLFVFVTNPEVDSTNNRAERGLRHSVIARKISGGSRSEKGARVYGILTSVVQTLQLRDLNLVSHGPAIISTSHG